MNKNLDAKLLVVMMSTHERLGADSGLEVLEDHIVKHSCDIFCNESKASSWVISCSCTAVRARLFVQGVILGHLLAIFCNQSRASSLLGKAGTLACLVNHHLETGAIKDEGNRGD